MLPEAAGLPESPVVAPPPDPVEQLYRELEAKLREYRPKDDVTPLERAYRYARKLHEGQSRDSGEPYMVHPLAVAHILADMRMDSVAIWSANLRSPCPMVLAEAMAASSTTRKNSSARSDSKFPFGVCVTTCSSV